MLGTPPAAHLDGMRTIIRQCARRGSHREEGGRWCLQHLPSVVGERRTARARAWTSRDAEAVRLLERVEAVGGACPPGLLRDIRAALGLAP